MKHFSDKKLEKRRKSTSLAGKATHNHTTCRYMAIFVRCFCLRTDAKLIFVYKTFDWLTAMAEPSTSSRTRRPSCGNAERSVPRWCRPEGYRGRYPGGRRRRAGSLVRSSREWRCSIVRLTARACRKRLLSARSVPRVSWWRSGLEMNENWVFVVELDFIQLDRISWTGVFSGLTAFIWILIELMWN